MYNKLANYKEAYKTMLACVCVYGGDASNLPTTSHREDAWTQGRGQDNVGGAIDLPAAVKELHNSLQLI